MNSSSNIFDEEIQSSIERPDTRSQRTSNHSQAAQQVPGNNAPLSSSIDLQSSTHASLSPLSAMNESLLGARRTSFSPASLRSLTSTHSAFSPTSNNTIQTSSSRISQMSFTSTPSAESVQISSGPSSTSPFGTPRVSGNTSFASSSISLSSGTANAPSTNSSPTSPFQAPRVSGNTSSASSSISLFSGTANAPSTNSSPTSPFRAPRVSGNTSSASSSISLFSGTANAPSTNSSPTSTIHRNVASNDSSVVPSSASHFVEEEPGSSFERPFSQETEQTDSQQQEPDDPLTNRQPQRAGLRKGRKPGTQNVKWTWDLEKRVLDFAIQKRMPLTFPEAGKFLEHANIVHQFPALSRDSRGASKIMTRWRTMLNHAQDPNLDMEEEKFSEEKKLEWPGYAQSIRALVSGEVLQNTDQPLDVEEVNQQIEEAEQARHAARNAPRNELLAHVKRQNELDEMRQDVCKFIIDDTPGAVSIRNSLVKMEGYLERIVTAAESAAKVHKELQKQIEEARTTSGKRSHSEMSSNSVKHPEDEEEE